MATHPHLLKDRRLHGLLLLAALLRLLVGPDVWSNDPTASTLLSDSLYYQGWAKSLVDQTSFAFENDQLAYWMPPLYARLLAWLSASTQAMLVLQGVVGVVTTFLIVTIGEQLFQEQASGRKAALLGGLLWNLYGPVIFFEGRLLNTSFATLLAAATFLFALRWRTSQRLLDLASCGVFLGLLSLLRPNTMLLVPALAGWLIWIQRRQLQPISCLLQETLLLAPLLLVLTPTLIHNFRATGGFVPITINGGINFYFGNNPASRGTFHAPGPEWGSISEQRLTARSIAAKGLGQPLDQVDDQIASRYWFGRGFDFLTSQPIAAVKLVALKAADLISSSELGIQYNLGAARSRAPSLWLICLPFGALLFFSVLGWQKKHSALAVAWLGAGTASALVYFTYSRFRLPLLPALVPFAGLGLLRFLQRRTQPKQLAIASLLLILSFVPFEGSYPKHLKSHALVDMATALEQTPKTQAERSELLDAALELVPQNKPALVTRALVALEVNAAQVALQKLEAAVLLPFEYPAAEFELARLLAVLPKGQSDLPRARSIIATWLSSHPADDPAAPNFRALRSALPKARQ